MDRYVSFSREIRMVFLALEVAIDNLSEFSAALASTPTARLAALRSPCPMIGRLRLSSDVERGR